MRMNYLLDAHTHTIASGHAYSTLMENVMAAQKKGLALLGITDHAPAMHGASEAVYFSNFRAVPREICGVELYLGVELNILDYEGKVDLPDSLLAQMDLVIASLHPPCIPFGTREENTNALLGAMKHPHIHVIGHPGDPRYPFDVELVVDTAEETGTLLEINNASLEPGGFRAGSDVCMKEILIRCKKKGLPILLGSDSHFSTNIGNFGYAEQLLFELDFPEELVLNTSVFAFKAALAKK